MIPTSYPSVLTGSNLRQVVIYILTDVTGLKEWVDYVPVKAPPNEALTALADTFANEGFLYSTTITDVTGLVAYKDYVPVYIKSAGTTPWSTDLSGYIPFANLTPAFSVASLFASGEQGLWYDPSDFSTMFQDSAGTIPVTAVNQPVGKILDKSGRGNHATQATSSSRPTLKIDGNGKYYLYFDGSDDCMATASINFTATDKMTIWAGVRKLADGGFPVIAELSSSPPTTNNSWTLITSSESNGKYLFGSRGTSNFERSSSILLSPRTDVLTAKYDIAGATADTEISARINGVAHTLTNFSGTTSGTGNYGNYPIYIGSRNNAFQRFTGNIYSLIVRGATTSGADIASTETYVAGKTGVTL